VHFEGGSHRSGYPFLSSTFESDASEYHCAKMCLCTNGIDKVVHRCLLIISIGKQEMEGALTSKKMAL